MADRVLGIGGMAIFAVAQITWWFSGLASGELAMIAATGAGAIALAAHSKVRTLEREKEKEKKGEESSGILL